MTVNYDSCSVLFSATKKTTAAMNFIYDQEIDELAIYGSANK